MEFTEFINRAVTPYHSVEQLRKMLSEAGFEELSRKAAWELKRGGAYMTRGTSGSLFAFVIGTEYCAGEPIAIELAHTDYPCLHIKPNAETGKYYAQLDVDVYGGPILNTWLDRPLGIAGRVFVRTEEGKIEERPVVSDGPVVTIPNLPIHFNREVNKGVELKRQVDLSPIADFGCELGWFADYVAELAGTTKDAIMEADLYVCSMQKAETIGIRKNMISSPRLDNQTSCYALWKAIGKAYENAASSGSHDISVAAWFDNEEIGSQTRQGADSSVLKMILDKIYDGLGLAEPRLHEAVFAGRCLSLDVAHALHPNHPEKYDRYNTASIGNGVVLKLSGNQKYAYSPELLAEVKNVLLNGRIPFALHTNHSDQPGGSTMGPLVSSWLPMPTVDAGVPILAMHSSCELMATSDQNALERLAEEFYAMA